MPATLVAPSAIIAKLLSSKMHPDLIMYTLSPAQALYESLYDDFHVDMISFLN